MPPRFDGDRQTDAADWAQDFADYVYLRDLTEVDARVLLRTRLTGAAKTWHESIPSDAGLDETLARLRRRFGGESSVSEFWQRRQGPDEPAGAYIEAKARLARRLGMDDDRITADVITPGLRPEIKKDVIMQRPPTIEDLLDVAEASEASNKAVAMATTAQDAELRAELADLRAAMSAMTCLLYTSPSPRDRQKSRMPSSA